MTDLTVTPTDDSFIASGYGDTNYNTYGYLVVNPRAVSYSRTLVLFDISSIPAGATIVSAILRLDYYAWTVNNPSGWDVDAHRIEESWAEDTVTWNNQPDHNASKEATTPMPASYGWVEWDVADLVQEWVDNTYTNYGIKLKYTSEAGLNSVAKFYDSENATPSLRPQLVIVYTAVTAPTVTTGEAYTLTDEGATLEGNITATGGEDNDERGFEWGTTTGVYPNSWTEAGTFGTGSYTHALTGLTAEIEIFFRAKSHNSEGWGYGAEKSFTPSATAQIDLRFSDETPPTTEPARTIYTDLVSLPDPVKLSLIARMYNQDSIGLYFQVEGTGTGWTFTTHSHGLIASGANAYHNIPAFGSKTKPASATEEYVTITLKAYTDAGYTSLRWSFARTILLVYIDSADGSWTTDELDNFDDATVQGWARVNETNVDSSSFAVSTDYALSPAYSLKTQWTSTNPSVSTRGRIYKSFTTPAQNQVFAIIDVRLVRISSNTRHAIYIRFPDSTQLLYASGDSGSESPRDLWLRFVVPLARSTTGEIQIAHQYWQAAAPSQAIIYLDDFKIISK